MKIVFHSLAFLLIGTFTVGAVPAFFPGSPHQLSPNFYNQPGLFRQANIPEFNKYDHIPKPGPIPQDQIGIAVQPGVFGQGQGQGPFGQLPIPGQPRFANNFDHPQKSGPIPQDQIGIAVQPGIYGQGQGPPGPFGQLPFPGQPIFLTEFDHPIKPGPIPQDQIGIAVQPGIYGHGQGQGPPGPFGQLPFPGQPRFLTEFDHPLKPGAFDQHQIGINVDPGTYGQPGPGQPMQSGPLLIPGQPRFANHFDHPQQPGPIPQDQIGIAVQPGVFGQGQRQGQGPFGQLSIPGQPRFSNQNGPILSPQPGSNDQLGPFGMGVPGSNLFQPQKPWVDSVNWQLQLNKQLNEEIAKKIREMLQNKTTGVPQMMTPISVPQNAWAPFPQNQWANRFHRSPLANLQALQAQGYQIIKLKDYQNLERRSASGPGGAFSKLNIRSDEKTSDKKSFGGSLAQNSTLNSTESFTDNVVANMRAASSSEHMIVGNPLEICKDYEIIDQHHPSKHNKEIKSFCKNFYQNVMPSFPSYPNEVLSTSHSEDYTVTDDISKMSDSSIRNLTQTRQQLPNNQQQKTQSDGQSKRFGDNFIGLSEELAKNSTNATAAPVQYRYRPSVNGNLPQQIPATIRANPPPKSTPRMNNYNSFHHPLAVGSALYKLPSLWPGNASNNNYNNKNFMNFAPVYPITPPNNYYLQKFPVYQTPNYFLYQ